ncbi:hypothetical protein TEA_023791 [Camellia sinensis var. sinensis]|uniref:Uncharacterized protein n=1 Tax=Camellia sinensis var. sinensis TaxID=542762 RepID=A0A4V6RYN8_CAMSN|nr:hypothetical protein TEA_023791 [Camellia sinensis var. sinensis]
MKYEGSWRVKALVVELVSCVSIFGGVSAPLKLANIQDFAPSPSSFLHIRELEDANSVAKTMKYLAKNPDAYNQSVRSSNLTLETLESAVLLKFKSLKHHVPIWKLQRPESIRGGDELKIYRVYPVSCRQNQNFPNVIPVLLLPFCLLKMTEDGSDGSGGVGQWRQG